MHRAVRRLSSAAQFRVASEGALKRIVIDHPSKRNALTLDMYRQLPRIAAEANGGRVALLEGVGDHFSAGSDISEFATLRADSYQAEEWDAVEIKAAESLRDLDIPARRAGAGQLLRLGVEFDAHGRRPRGRGRRYFLCSPRETRARLP